MKNTKILALWVIVFSVCVGQRTLAVDLNGEYWFGALGTDTSTDVPFYKTGSVVISADTWQQEWTDQTGAGYNYASAFTMMEQSDGSVDLAFPEGVYNIAWNGNVMVHADTVGDSNGQLGFEVLIRKEDNSSIAEISGDYHYLGHFLGRTGRWDVVSWGDMSLNANGLLDILFDDTNGDSGSDSRAWALDPSNGALLLDSSLSIFPGQGGLLSAFHIDSDGDEYGYEFLVKKTNDPLTLAEIAGNYQVRFLETGPGGVAFTCGQGTCAIKNNGKFAVDAYYSNGEHDVFNATFAIGSGNVLSIKGDSAIEGVVSLERDLIILTEKNQNASGRTEDDWIGNLFLIKEAPVVLTPAAVGLTLVGSKLPTTVIAGNGEKFLLTAWVENAGQVPFDKTAAVDINFYARNIADDQLTEISQLDGKSIKNLKPGRVAKCKTTAYIPVSLPAGTYTIEAAIDGTYASIPDYTLAVQPGYLDFTMVAGKVTLPSDVVAGETERTAIQITVTNAGNVTTAKTLIAEVAVLARLVGGGEELLYETSVKFGNLKPGKGKKLNLRPAVSFAAGTYDIIVQLTVDTVPFELNVGTIESSAAYVDLACDLGSLSISEPLVRGSKTRIKLPVEISNMGNVPLAKTDTVDIQVYLRNESGGQVDELIASLSEYKVGNLTNGKPKKIKLSVPTISETVPVGDYRFVIVIDSRDEISESDEGNNEAVSNAILTLESDNDFSIIPMTWVAINDDGAGMIDENGNPVDQGGFTGEMSKYLTTNAQYCKYLNAALASGDIKIQDGDVYGNGGSYDDMIYFNIESKRDERISYSRGVFRLESFKGYSIANHPVDGISWYGATAFCDYYGYRLPTEWEWQAVADYDGSYTYGCGTTIDKTKANYDNANPLNISEIPTTTPVDYYPSYGYGMNDMVGNVSEWTNSWYTYNPIYRVIRGSSDSSELYHCPVYKIGIDEPDGTSNGRGFRVCR